MLARLDLLSKFIDLDLTSTAQGTSRLAKKGDVVFPSIALRIFYAFFNDMGCSHVEGCRRWRNVCMIWGAIRISGRRWRNFHMIFGRIGIGAP